MQHTPIATGNASAPPMSVAPLRPALLARYAGLEELRYDYPLVLTESMDGQHLFRPLSRIIDNVLRATATPGPAGEALRQQVLRLEMRIRHAVAEGQEGRLSDLWRELSADLIRQSGEAPFGPLDTNLDTARRALKVDGLVIGCDAGTPGKVLTHAWEAVHAERARRFRKRVDGLILRLSDILKSDFMKSDEAHGPKALESAMGAHRDGSVDFGALSAVLARARPEDRIPNDRVERIRKVLAVLKCQPFYAPGRASHFCANRRETYSYTFDSCSAALDALRERLPDVLDFTKALTIAELEVENKYRAELHDPIFEQFDESDLTSDQMGLLPSSLVFLRDGVTDPTEITRAFEALASQLPITILIQTDDILGATSPEPPRASLAAGTARLAAMAMGLNNAFVLQSASAHLYRMRDRLVGGLHFDGPALFSIYSGATATAPGIPAYILSAAATESRAFPSFTYDPTAGPDWARRFDLSDNPQNDVDWPQHDLAFEDAIGQRQSESVAFTFADFAVCDQRYARFCHSQTRVEWTTTMVPVCDWLKETGAAEYLHKPYVCGVDPDDRMVRIVVDDKITEAARRCNDAWRRLQELAGINNSHALKLLADERKARESAARTAEPPAPSMVPVADVQAPTPVVASTAIDGPEVTPDKTSDDGPWIETARCTTCNECTQISKSLFAYNENMQAYVADPDGGTYRQLVEAAESCQVSIIHPGKPRNPQEPNLDDLIERAEAFN